MDHSLHPTLDVSLLGSLTTFVGSCVDFFFFSFFYFTSSIFYFSEIAQTLAGSILLNVVKRKDDPNAVVLTTEELALTNAKFVVNPSFLFLFLFFLSSI